MYHYQEFDKLDEANETFDQMRAQEKQGKVRWVSLTEAGPVTVRLWPLTKRYQVAWHTWVD